MEDFIKLEKISKIYKNDFHALKNITLNIKKGEVFALLGPNGAGKSTLINVICGLAHQTTGEIYVDNFNIKNNRKLIKSKIGLVPQELHLEAFETVIDNVNYSRGLWGEAKNDKYIIDLLKTLKLYDKKDNLLMQLSGGMKRRVLIAKALSHNPEILFLDEPSAGVDVELRREMWLVINSLKQKGVTIILTTHYIEEAEEIADTVGFINNGKLILVENKKKLLSKLGNKKLVLTLPRSIKKKPAFLRSKNVKISADKKQIEIMLKNDNKEIIDIVSLLKKNKFEFIDINLKKRTLESIFVDYIKRYKNDKL